MDVCTFREVRDVVMEKSFSETPTHSMISLSLSAEEPCLTQSPGTSQVQYEVGWFFYEVEPLATLTHNHIVGTHSFALWKHW